MSDSCESREFPLGTVLGCVYGLILPPDGVAGLMDLTSYMAGEGIHHHQLFRVADECSPELIRRHPKLADPRIKSILDRMRAEIEAADVSDEPNLPRWISEEAVRTIFVRVVFASSLPVSPLPIGAHVHVDPVREAVEMFGADKVIPVRG